LDLSEYWKDRGRDYYNELQRQPKYDRDRLKLQEENFIKFIKKYKFKTILEIGCGFGRYTKIINSILKPEKYVAIDISEKQIENAKKVVSDNKVDFQCIKIQDFQSTEKFEMVFASEILMHINFEDIEEVIKKLLSLSSDKIFSIDWYDDTSFGKTQKSYCFMHNYKTLYEKNRAKNVQIHMLPTSIILKMISTYAQLRGRHGIEKQAIIEVDV